MKDKLSGKIGYGIVLLALLLSASACGRTENPKQEMAEEGMTAVADFHYMELSKSLEVGFQGEYTINGEWIYIMEARYYSMAGDEDSSRYVYVSRNRISDGYRDQNYIIRERKEKEGFPQTFLADGAGNCYLFWGAYDGEQDAVYAMEKYGADGELLWQREYAPEELQNIGDRLTQGTVTEDGRVLLYSYGTDGRVFSFSENGDHTEIYDPRLETLEGIAVGKDGRAYAYGTVKEKLLFTELGGEEVYACPVVPLAVSDGYGYGICLQTEEGMWNYDPETGVTERLWNWDDDYIQISQNNLDRIFCGNGEFMIMCRQENGSTHARPALAFASVTFKDSSEYPEKQRLTLVTNYANDFAQEMVRYYNRHSREYKVEINAERDAVALEMQLVQGKGPDLIDISALYAGNLAEQGAFEDLTPYYEASEAVKREDILDSVRRACTVRGKEVGIIPAFWLTSYLTKEACSTPEEWTVWKFLEMGLEKRMLEDQDAWVSFERCMGIRYGEHFVDWENRECHFDSEEFRRMLELCGRWENYEDSQKISGNQQELMEGEWLIGSGLINSVWSLVSDTDEDYSAKLPGYPGWNGGEYELESYGMFAINSASEHKEGAWDFLEYILSEEFQGMVKFGFPVRKSSFEASLEDLYISPARLDSSWFLGEPAIPTKEDIALLRKMVDAAVYDDFGGLNNPVWLILADEVQMYFAGDATLDDTVRKIQNRMQIYLDER